jgi:hypothetical protein
MPLVLLNPVLLAWRQSWLVPGAPLRWRRLVAFSVVQVLLLVACGLYKAAYTGRLVEASAWEHLAWFAKLLVDAAGTAIIGDFGLGLPRVLADIVLRHDVGPIVGAAAAGGLVVFAYLSNALRAGEDGLPSRREAGWIMVAAAVVFVGGYGIFLLTFNAGISTTGMSNRIGLAAAIGIALALVALAAWLVSWLPGILSRRSAFAALVATTCAAGFLVTSTLGLFWVEAAGRQQAILRDLRAVLPQAPPGGVLVLDGACEYVGPAPVFEAWWGWSGAIRLLYGDDRLSGDVVNPRMEVGVDGLYATTWGERIGPYRYESLLVYDRRRAAVHRLAGPAAARAYFAAFNPALDSGCRPNREGHGERLFVPGAPRARWPAPPP